MKRVICTLGRFTFRRKKKSIGETERYTEVIGGKRDCIAINQMPGQAGEDAQIFSWDKASEQLVQVLGRENTIFFFLHVKLGTMIGYPDEM